MDDKPGIMGPSTSGFVIMNSDNVVTPLRQPNGPQKLLLIGYSHGSLISMAGTYKLNLAPQSFVYIVFYPPIQHTSSERSMLKCIL